MSLPVTIRSPQNYFDFHKPLGKQIIFFTVTVCQPRLSVPQECLIIVIGDGVILVPAATVPLESCPYRRHHRRHFHPNDGRTGPLSHLPTSETERRKTQVKIILWSVVTSGVRLAKEIDCWRVPIVRPTGSDRPTFEGIQSLSLTHAVDPAVMATIATN